jgi:uncharacterized protein
MTAAYSTVAADAIGLIGSREGGYMGEAESGAVELEAAVFRRLVAHLQSHTEVQNIDLMNLAGFCRNCLSKWYVEAAAERGLVVDAGAARERVYGMPYEEWKSKYQKP